MRCVSCERTSGRERAGQGTENDPGRSTRRPESSHGCHPRGALGTRPSPSRPLTQCQLFRSGAWAQAFGESTTPSTEGRAQALHAGSLAFLPGWRPARPQVPVLIPPGEPPTGPWWSLPAPARVPPAPSGGTVSAWPTPFVSQTLLTRRRFCVHSVLTLGLPGPVYLNSPLSPERVEVSGS